MKGKLNKTSTGWEVMYTETNPQMMVKEWNRSLPLNPYDEHYSYAVEDSDWQGKEVEFEIEEFWETGMELEIVKVATLKSTISKAVDENNYPLIQGTIDLCDDIVQDRKNNLKKQKELAESLWEGCDGCTEHDKEFWIKGFISGLRYNQE